MFDRHADVQSSRASAADAPVGHDSDMHIRLGGRHRRRRFNRRHGADPGAVPLRSSEGHQVATRRTPREPSRAWNAALRACTGSIVIMQSGDVVHHLPDTIQRLCDAMEPQKFIVCATTSAIGEDGVPHSQWLPGTDRHPRFHGWHVHSVYARGAIFYLGAAWRKDICRIGGCDERFTAGGYDDFWLTDCLTSECGCEAVFRDDIIGIHQQHDFSGYTEQGASVAKLPTMEPSRILYWQLRSRGIYHTETAPWPYP